MLCWYYIAVADAMSESIRTVCDWEIGGDRYYYEMPAFDSVHAECIYMMFCSTALIHCYCVIVLTSKLSRTDSSLMKCNVMSSGYPHSRYYDKTVTLYFWLRWNVFIFCWSHCSDSCLIICSYDFPGLSLAHVWLLSLVVSSTVEASVEGYFNICAILLHCSDGIFERTSFIFTRRTRTFIQRLPASAQFLLEETIAVEWGSQGAVQKQDCLLIEGRPPANYWLYAKPKGILLLWPWPWPDDLDLRTWPEDSEEVPA